MFLERGLGTYYLGRGVPVRPAAPRIHAPSARGRVEIRACSAGSRSAWGRLYLFRGQDERGGGVAPVLVENRTFVAFALVFVFLVFAVFAATHSDCRVQIGPSLALHRPQAEAMHLTLRNHAILIVLHFINKYYENTAPLTPLFPPPPPPPSLPPSPIALPTALLSRPSSASRYPREVRFCPFALLNQL